MLLLTEVDKVHDAMEPGLEEDDGAGDLVQVDVLVQREDLDKAELAEEGDKVAEDEEQDHHGIEVQGHACEVHMLSAKVLFQLQFKDIKIYNTFIISYQL